MIWDSSDSKASFFRCDSESVISGFILRLPVISLLPEKIKLQDTTCFDFFVFLIMNWMWLVEGIFIDISCQACTCKELGLLVSLISIRYFEGFSYGFYYMLVNSLRMTSCIIFLSYIVFIYLLFS